MTTEQLIEKVVTKQRKILAEATTFDEMAIRIEKLIREALSTIASKVAEEERKRAVEILDSFIDEVLSNNGASLEDLLNRIKGK